MQTNTAPIYLINASAGSGKTYTLVQEYLFTVLGDPAPRKFRSLLALTFTNKAVYEMKFRILEYLNAFIADELGSAQSMFTTLQERLDLSEKELKTRAKRVLTTILKDYGAFDVITLDRFTHRIIRGFAKDLGLSFDFEVQLDVESMLNQVVDRVLLKVGQDAALTKKLEAYTYQKMDADLSWDIKKELIKTARLLLDENDRVPLAELRKFTSTDFERQQNFLNAQKKTLTGAVVAKAQNILDRFQGEGLTEADFSKSTKLFERFRSLAQGQFKGVITAAFVKNVTLGEKIYNKTLAADKKQCIDSLLPQIQENFVIIQEKLAQLDLIEAIFKYWIPQGLIHELSKELETFQEEENQLLLGTFNAMISKEILQHQNLRIYERLGETYRHFFVDEFQDTSSLQWENLIPLLKNPLESMDEAGNHGTLLVVGDPKQSIYRWRGGNVRQFIRLFAGENPFQVPYRFQELDKNYRSLDQIVLFNNALYAHLGSFTTHDLSKNLFTADAQQKICNKPGGYVQLKLLPPDLKKEDLTPLYVTQTLKAIQEAIEDQYALGDIAVLVRTNDQAKQITHILAEENIDFISSDALQYGESKAVNVLISLLVCAIYPSAIEYKYQLLCYLFQHKTSAALDQHSFIIENLSRSFPDIFSSLSIAFDLNTFLHDSVYESFEKAYYAFGFAEQKDAFVESFIEVVFEFSQTAKNDVFSFFDYWLNGLSKKSIGLSETLDSVKVMTVHKSKGLGFPVVIFPFAEQPFQPKQRPMIWLDTKEHFGNNYPQAWIPFSEKVKSFGESGEHLDRIHKAENEMDVANLLYVATTRAMDRLYIISKEISKPEASLAGVFNAFVEKDSSLDGVYSWGKREAKKKREMTSSTASLRLKSSRYPWEERLLKINRDDTVFSAQTFGIKMHDLLAQIQTKEDIAPILESAEEKGVLEAAEVEHFRKNLFAILTHPDLEDYFSNESKGYNEQELLYDNSIYRPDRYVVFHDHCVVIDYKTGKKDEKHKEQLQRYASVLKEIYHLPVKQFLVYFDPTEIELVSL